MRRRAKRRKLFTGCLEEILQVLLAQVQEFQPGFVRHGRMGAGNGLKFNAIGADTV